MTTMVRFMAGKGAYVVPLEHALEVRTLASMRSLPDPAPGVEGIVDHEGRALPVVRALGFGGRQVLLLQRGEQALGLLVDEVTGVVDVATSDAGPPPAGQRSALVAGTVREGDALAYVLDVGQLADDLVGLEDQQ